jgi:3',5'-cyclic AMP phosphodiesterase CpdA
MRILHLSDLHIGEKNRGLDLSCGTSSTGSNVGRSKEYITEFCDYLKTTIIPVDGNIDLICVTGDIANGASPEEYRLALAAFTKIAASCGKTIDDVIWVPGNHDVHWPVMKLTPKDFWTKFRYEPFKELGSSSTRKAPLFGSLHEFPFFEFWDREDVAIIGINSAAYDDPDSKHHGAIYKDQLNALEGLLSEKQIPRDKLKICLIHHHLIQYTEPIPESADFSILVGAEALAAILAENKFDLLLHGHKHFPRVRSHMIDNGHPLVSNCAGSFSAILDPLYYQNVTNTFHIVNIRDRDEEKGFIKGFTESWVRSAETNWTKATAPRGISSPSVFGSLLTKSEIKIAVSLLLARLSSSSTYGVSNLIDLKPELQWVNRNVLRDCIHETAATMGYGLHGDVTDELTGWVLFKKP